MSRKHFKPLSNHTQDNKTEHEKAKSQRRDFFSYALGGLGTIAFFFTHKTTPWMGYIGIFFILTGIIVYGHGKFKAMLLYPIFFLVCIFLLFLNHFLQTDYITEKPVIDISIGNFILQKGTPPASFLIKYENISQSPARHFYNVTRLCVDSVTDRDSLDLLDIVARHKEENVTLVKELSLTKIPFDTLSEFAFNYLSKQTLFILGAIGYYDESNKYHLSYFCFELLKNNRYKNYPKYNSPL